jgi:hypothetical protein
VNREPKSTSQTLTPRGRLFSRKVNIFRSFGFGQPCGEILLRAPDPLPPPKLHLDIPASAQRPQTPTTNTNRPHPDRKPSRAYLCDSLLCLLTSIRLVTSHNVQFQAGVCRRPRFPAQCAGLAACHNDCRREGNTSCGYGCSSY